MPAAKSNIKIEKGATFKLTFFWKDENEVAINLTGYTARMQIRSSVNATGAALLELTTANGGIVITPLTGKIEITISAHVTKDLAWTSGVYDLELVLPGTPSPDNDYVYRLVQGNVSVIPEVTR